MKKLKRSCPTKETCGADIPYSNNCSKDFKTVEDIISLNKIFSNKNHQNNNDIYNESTTITTPQEEELQKESDYDFRSNQFGNIRRLLTLYFFNLFMDTELDYFNLISHLNEFYISKIVLEFKKVIIESNVEDNLYNLFTDKDIKKLQNLANTYPNDFAKYFCDLFEIIRLLIISNKSHKIIGADFSLQHFVKFLTNNAGINLFMTYKSLWNEISDTLKILKTTKYSYLFPNQARQSSSKNNHDNEIIIGSRIKLFAMKHLYNGRYFDNNKDIAICPECEEEGLIINTYVPRISAKEFHHEDERLEGYTVGELYDLFCKSRGDPYFLPKLIEKMELESVVLRCGCHHRTLRPSYSKNFRKIINWEDIPAEFPQNIFDLPADIIHMLIMVCVDNYNSLELLYGGIKKKKKFDIIERKYDMKVHILKNLKKKYIIDIIYNGICPVCGEFNTIEHLNSFDISHLYELNILTELTPEEKKEKKKERKRLKNLFRFSSCSELVKELKKQKVCYVCHNCHAVFHKDTSLIDQIYDNQNIINKILDDKTKVIEKFVENIIFDTSLIRDPLKTEKKRYDAFMRHLIALYELSKSKYDGATRKDMQVYLNLNTDKNVVFETTSYAYKYVKIVSGTKHRATRYYITDEGKKIVRLIYYFRDYYKNLTYENDYY